MKKYLVNLNKDEKEKYKQKSEGTSRKKRKCYNKTIMSIFTLNVNTLNT